MKIQITQDDIDFGIKKSCTHCPLALCLKRYYDTVQIKNFEVTVNDVVLVMSRKLQQFVSDFDENKIVEPFEFAFAMKESHFYYQLILIWEYDNALYFRGNEETYNVPHIYY